MIAGDNPAAGSNGVIGFHIEAPPISTFITIGRVETLELLISIKNVGLIIPYYISMTKSN